MARVGRRIKPYDLSPDRLRLYLDNQGLVFSACRRVMPGANATELEELVQAGRGAMLNAAERFDASRGFRFSTYAYRAIVNAVRSRRRREAKHCSRRIALTRLALRIIPAEGPAPEDVADHRLQMDKLEALILQLDARQQRVIRGRRFGVPPDTLESIGRELGLSKERVRQIEVEAVEKLRTMARSQPA